MKTAKQIQGDVWRLLRDSNIIRSEITGGIYRDGARPRDSRKEDAVVIFTSGSATQIQEGVVTINIFVPDVDIHGDGLFMEDGFRCEEIEVLAQKWANTLTADRSEYFFELADIIHTSHDDDIKQAFVVVRLSYKCLARKGI